MIIDEPFKKLSEAEAVAVDLLRDNVNFTEDRSTSSDYQFMSGMLEKTSSDLYEIKRKQRRNLQDVEDSLTRALAGKP